MTYHVCKIAGAARFESLPVAKITSYPLEKRDYKPFAQSITCVNESELIVRLWAFEVSPLPESMLQAVFYLWKDSPDIALIVDLYSDGRCAAYLYRNSAKISDLQADTKSFGGEDLQGVYWGATIALSLETLQATGCVSLEVGDIFDGNFYKICEKEPFIHYGGFYPADFALSPLEKENMGKFCVVDF